MAKNGFQTLQLESRPDGSTLLWIDLPERKLNVLNRQVLLELDRAIDQVIADSACRLLVILSRKTSGFLAGADLQEFAAIRTGVEASAISADGQRLFDKLARIPIETVAIIHGPCLGGGLELALACDHRLAIDQRGTQFGLPEIDLGLLPAWGGTQRLPRTIGIERSLHVILMRKRFNGAEAEQWGLAEGIFADQSAAISHAIDRILPSAQRRAKDPTPQVRARNWRQRLLESTRAGRWLLWRGAERLLRRKVPDDMPAPHEAFRSIRIGLTHGMTAGLAAEREGIGRLAITTACRNLMTLFFLIEKARKGEPLDQTATESELPFRRVGVIGGGTMGAGIAQLALIKGATVVLKEINEELLAAGKRKVEELFQKAVSNGVLNAKEAQSRMSSLVTTTGWEEFGEVDLVVEAIVEDAKIKRQVFADLERHVSPGAILASNTSSICIAELQKGLSHPNRVGGLHFFNPVHKMPLVEVVRAAETSPRVANDMARWASALGKIPVIVGDSPGFIVNRILVPYLNEAGMLVSEGMPVEAVDRVMQRFGMPMGPLELLDQVGLDIASHVAKSVQPLFDGRLSPHAALDRMCQRGWLGQKTGRGFYCYEGKKKTVDRQAMEQLRSELANERAGTPPDDEQARERMVLLMVNEAALALAEKLGDRADVIDLAMVLGTGWAPHRGGPLRYADDWGVARVVDTLEKLARNLGQRFTPCEELRRRRDTKDAFYANLPLAQSA